MAKDLTVGKPSTVLWKFSLPLFGSVVFQQLYNIADSFVAGKFIGDGKGEAALAAVGNAYEITLVFLAFAFGCNIGMSVIVSQLFGAKKYGDMKSAISTGCIASAVLSLLLTVLGFIFTPFLLRLINTPEAIFSDSLCYLNIYIAGLFFLFFYNISTGIFSALGDSKTPFIFLMFSSVSNILIDICFVKFLGLGVKGVALATFICQGVSCILSVCVLFSRLRKIEVSGKIKLFSFHALKKIISIAVPSMLQQSFVSVGNIFVQSLVNSFGASVMAGYSAAIKLNNFAVTSFVTLGNGMSNYTAQNIGAGKNGRVKEGLRAGIVMAASIAAVFTALFLIFGESLVSFFMDVPGEMALKTGKTFLTIVSPFFIVASAKIMCDGVLRGGGAMESFMASTFTDLLIRVVLSYILSAYFGATGIWLSWPIGWLVAFGMSLTFYLVGNWERRSKKLTQ